MKKLVGITALILLISFSINAQQRQNKQRKSSDFTPEQTATLKVKKMTLDLDLNASQQTAVYALMKSNTEDRQKSSVEKAKNKQNDVQLTSDQKFELQKNRLDKMIAHKAALKNILSKDQFEKWEEIMADRKKLGNKNMSKNNKKGARGENQKNCTQSNRI